MAATAQKSYGTKVKGTSVGTIGGLTGFSLSGVEVNMIDVSAWDGDGWAAFLGGLKNGGTAELSGRCDISDVGQSGLIANAGNKDKFTVTLTSGQLIEFSAIVGGYATSAGEDDAVEFSCTLQVTGEIDFKTSGGGGGSGT